MKIIIGRRWVMVALLLMLSNLGGCATKVDKRRAELVQVGLAQIGTPYVYGGSNPAQGFDCSGLTYYAHQSAGVAIPRVARKQQQASIPVKGNWPRPGDMVFFKTGPSTYHVGLMVDKERFVHASTSRRQVLLDRLNKPYWQARYLGAGTYLN